MKYASTRNPQARYSLSDAVLAGTAPDGGLFMPEAIPAAPLAAVFSGSNRVQFAQAVLRPFFAEDILAPCLARACERAFAAPQPIRFLAERVALLELFHGPTCAFKDFGAAFLAACLGALREMRPGGAPSDVLVATSGDTGAAVAAAFHDLPGVRTVVLFPHGRVSQQQQQQLCCWPASVVPLAVKGDFDACQQIMKALLAGDARRQRTSANSVNIGRLLPQVAYAAWAAVRYQRLMGRPAGFVVPTGNLGNACGAFLARAMGFPIREIVLAVNESSPLAQYYETGVLPAVPARATLASAMDVARPSNLERLGCLAPRWTDLRACSRVVVADDAAIRGTMARTFRSRGLAVCPHTAVALHAQQVVGGDDWVVFATAHPGKFPGTLDATTGCRPELPLAARRQLARARPCREVEASTEGVEAMLEEMNPACA